MFIDYSKVDKYIDSIDFDKIYFDINQILDINSTKKIDKLKTILYTKTNDSLFKRTKKIIAFKKKG
jgi:hypothetical protein